MSNLTVYNKSMEISKDGQVFPYSDKVPDGYKINLGHPYAGMGIELELKKVTGWSDEATTSGNIVSSLDPIPYPNFVAAPNDIVLTYAYYTPNVQVPIKPQSDPSNNWNAMPIFEVGSEITIEQEFDKKIFYKQGVIVSRNIYTSDKTPTLEVTIKPYHPGWARNVLYNAGVGDDGMLLDIPSPLFGPVPFYFVVQIDKHPTGGKLQLDLFVKHRAKKYIGTINSPNNKPDIITDKITFYGPELAANKLYGFTFYSDFPFESYITDYASKYIVLGPYLYNESKGAVISSPKLFIPGGDAVVNIWCEVKINNKIAATTLPAVGYRETIIL